MAFIPTKFEKTWQWDINRVPSDLTSVLGQAKSFAWWWKALLTGQQGGATQGLWTVFGSSDSATAGLDAVDRWTSTYNAAKIVRAAAGSAHSWIVLVSPTFITSAGSMNLYLTLDFAGTADSTPVIPYLSKAAPTGGSITARPTATDEWAFQGAGTQLQVNNNTIVNYLFHGWLTTEGGWVVTMTRDGSQLAETGAMCLPMLETHAADLYPFATGASYFAGNTPFLETNTGMSQAAGFFRMRYYDGSGITNAATAIAPYQAGNSFQASTADWDKSDDTSASSTDFPIYIAQNDAGAKALRGRLPDLRWCGDLPWAGTSEPPYGKMTSSVLGHIWFPTDRAFQMF